MKKFILLLLLAISCIPSAWADFFLPVACRAESSPSVPLSQAQNLNPKVLALALQAYHCAIKTGHPDPRHLLTIIDYSLPSTERRLWVVDLNKKQVLFNTLVAQGRFTGGLFARYFSDKPRSRASSLGLFETSNTYMGHNGYSMRLKGLEPGFNDKAEARDIVLHGAWYVSNSFAKHTGRLGLSWGCPAVAQVIARPMINLIKDGTLVFAYYPDSRWLSQSKFLHCPL